MINSRLAVAVHILALISSSEGEPLSSEMIASSVNTNPVVIRRLTGLLRKAGLLETQAGRTGAILTKQPENITLLMVYRAVEPKEDLFMIHESPNPDCPIGREIQTTLETTFSRAQRALEAELAAETLADVINRLGAT